MAGLTYIFYILLLILLFGACVVSGILAGIGIWKKRVWMKVLFIPAFIGLGLLLSGIVLNFFIKDYRSSKPALVFEDTFGKNPPPGTVFLSGGSYAVGDERGIDLAFRTDRNTFDSIRPQILQRVNLEQYRARSSFQTPQWLKMDPTTEIWMAEERSNDVSISMCIMTWDQDGLVQYAVRRY
jgi:hypothetical protein